MKSVRQLASGILVTVLLVVIFGAVSAWATDRYVATTGTDAGNCSNPATPCQTIQYAIGQASAGDTIHVAAGTYNETISINKSLTLRGAQFGVDARNRNASEAVISSTNESGTILIGPVAGTVTIDGFKLSGTPTQGRGGVVFVSGLTTNVLVRNTIVEPSTADGIFFWNARNGTAERNWVKGAALSGITGGKDAAMKSVLTIRNNLIESALFGISGYLVNSVISGNVITGTATQVNGAGIGGQFFNTTITGNQVSGYTAGTGLAFQNYLFRGMANITANNNSFSENAVGIYVNHDIAGLGIAANCNNIANNSIGGVVYGPSGDGTLNAENNWWGCAAGPGNAGCDLIQGNVDFTPWVRVQVPPGVQCGLGGVTDTDNDGLADTLEMGGTGDQDPNTTTDPLDPDTDNDGLLDGEDENRNGKVDSGETDPNNLDTDGDNLCDGSALLPTGTACTTVSRSGRNGEDLDGDENPADRGVTETDPTKPDTDGDGIDDFNDDIPLKRGSGCLGVRAYSTPTRVTYRPTARMASTRIIVVTIINNSGGPITVEGFTPQPDEQFDIVRVSPTPPRTIFNRKRASFSVLTRVPAGRGTVTAIAPYFDIDLDCGVVSSAGVKLTPLELKGVQAEMYNNQLRVEAYGAGISSMQVEFFDLAGRPVMEQESKGNVLVIALPTGVTGKPLAKGVYLYVVTVKGYDGSIQRSEVRKLVLR